MARQQQPGGHTPAPAARPTSPLGESNANLLGNPREPAPATAASPKATRADGGRGVDERAERASRPLSAANRSGRERKEVPLVGDGVRRRDEALSPGQSPGQSFAGAPRSAWGAGGSAASTPSAFQASDVASPASSAAFSPSSFPVARAHESEGAPQSSRFERRREAGSTVDGSGDRSSGNGQGRRRESGANSATDQNGRPLSPSTQWAVKRAAPILTGNAEADADIIAFYKAREKLLSNARLGAPGAPQSAQDGRR